MTITLDQLRAAAEARRLDAQRTRDATGAAASQIVTAAHAAGRSQLTVAEAGEVADLRAQRDRARAEIDAAAQQLQTLDQWAADEAAHAARSAQTHPSGFPVYRLPAHDGSHRPGQLPGSRENSPGRWIRTNDQRPAVAEPGQRLRDQVIVAEQAARTAERDAHVIGMHGGLGSLVRAMSTTSGSAVVPTVWAADIIDRARNLAAVTQAGAEIVPMDAKIIQIGRLTADPSAGFRAEGGTITASDPTFDNVTLTATTLSALVIGSLEWFQDVSPGGGADQLVTEALAKVIAVTLDQAALMGGITTGGEGINLPNPPNPRGILATLLAVASTSVLGNQTNGTAQTAATFYKEILDAIWLPRDNNEAPNAMIWPSRLARVYAEAVDTQNNPMRVPADVEQITKFVSNNAPSGFSQGTGTTMADVFVGDFTQLLIGQRLDLQIQTLTERYAEVGQVGILATWRGDIQLARPRAFSVYRYLKGV